MLNIPPMPTLAILMYAAGLAWLCLWRSGARLAGIGFMLAGLAVYASARPPDVLVSPDARLIAVRHNAQVFLLRQKKASSYTLAQWEKTWAGAPMTEFAPDVPAPAALHSAAGCLFAPSVLVLFGQNSGACTPAALVISPEPLRGACNARGTLVVDRFSVWREGAIAVWTNRSTPRMVSDKDVQGSRPWVPPWPDW
jgi:competence protein ComEC